MMQAKPYKIAVITVDSVKRRSFGWLASGGKPFVQLDPADIDDDLVDSVFNLYKSVYSQINPTLPVTLQPTRRIIIRIFSLHFLIDCPN